MKRGAISILLAGLFCALTFCSVSSPVAAQEQDVIAAVKKGTEDLTAADKVVVAARNALLASRRNMNPAEFNSAAYNVNISSQQLEETKQKYEKAEEAQKQDALEAYQLSQEIAERRKVAFEAAQVDLPKKEAEFQDAEAKYNVALEAALKLAEQIKGLVRQGDSDAQTALKSLKEATEAAAFAKAAVEQHTAASTATSKTFADFTAADAALQQAAAALKQATDADRAQKQTDAQNAVKAAVVALQTALPNLGLKVEESEVLKSAAALVEADKLVQKTAAALDQAKKDVEAKTNAVTQSENRVKAAQEGLEKRVAKIRAQKDLEREQQATQRAITAKQEAEALLPQKTADAEQAQQAYAALLQSTVQSLLSTEAEQILPAIRDTIAKTIAAKEAEQKSQLEGLTKQAADAQGAADKAQAALTAVEKNLAAQVAVREALSNILRQRFLRQASFAVDDMRKEEGELAKANRELQPKVAAFNKAVNDIKPLQAALAKAQEQAAAKAKALAEPTAAKDAADKAHQEKVAAKNAAEQAVKDAQTAVAAAQEALTKAAEADKPAAQKAVDEKAAAAKAAEQAASEAQQGVAATQAALDKAVAALQAVQKQSDEAAQAAKAAEEKVVAAQALIDTATAEKDAAEKVVAQHKQVVDAAPAKIAVIRAQAHGGLKALDQSAWDYAKARHLLVRAGFGGTPDEVARLHAMGLYGAVTHLVYFKNLPPAGIEFVGYPKERPEAYEGLLNGDEQRRMRDARVARDRKQILDMRTWWLQRMIQSQRPLEEKLTLFWHGHFASQYSDVGDSYYMLLQNQLFRDNAAGNFGTLLYGIAHDAAMLKYLNNDTNVKGRANENLAREIMELFGMGRDQGYSEIDIRQGARALTGFTYDSWTGQFRNISTRHDTDPKKIFGKEGNWNGDDFVQLILETPYPPKFIARQLFVYFAHDEPSPDVVEALTNVLRHNNLELAPMLENLFLSEEFYSSQAMATQVKGPIQLIVGLHRDLGLKEADLTYLASATREMGQELFEPPSVFGWQGGLTWVTTARTFSRYNTLAEVLERRPRAGKTGVDLVGGILADKTFADHAAVVDYLVKACMNVPLSDGKRQALIEFVKDLPAPADWKANPNPVNAKLTRMLVMLMCSPEYQLN